MIFLIDDDEIQNLINTKVISIVKNDIKVQSFTSAENALNCLMSEQKKPFLIFLDINMPKMNGWDFLDAYMEKGGSIPIYMLSSSINNKDVDRAKGYSIVKDFICKPLIIDNLRDLLIENELM